MKTALATITAAIAILTAACTTSEPVVRQVEVTRVVERTVPVEVTVPVTRIVEQTVEVEATIPVTRTVETSVEVTREVTREVPVSIFVTPTPPPDVATPQPTHTPGQIATSSVSPQGMALESMQVMFVNHGDHLQANAAPRFRLHAPDLDVYVDVSLEVDDGERCETTRIRWGREETEHICDLEFRSHSTVQRVSLQTPEGDLQCERDDYSDDHATYFSCVRSSPQTTLEDMGIYFVNYGNHLQANAFSYFALDVPELDIFVDVDLVVDDKERCDNARIYWSRNEPEVICVLPFRSHTTVQNVALQTSQGDLQCERDDFSDALFTSFTCMR